MLVFNERTVIARFIKRYKRFFMDAFLPDGQEVVSHAANTGSMLGLLQAESRLLLTKSLDPKRKTGFSAQAIEVDGNWVGINTHLPNKLVQNSLDHPLLKNYKKYPQIKAEVAYGKDDGSRVDFYFYGHEKEPPLYLEIKNTTMKVGQQAQFPDAISIRGQKHLRDLMEVVKLGFKAELLFIVQRQDCQEFSASDIDLSYKKLLQEAKDAGVVIRALCAKIDEQGLSLTHEIPISYGF